MGKLIIDQEKIQNPKEMTQICPFGAMEEKNGVLEINAACKMCKLCIKKGPKGAVTYEEDAMKEEIDKEAWKGIAVYVDHVDGQIHPVTYELIGKAKELAEKINQPVYALFIGKQIEKQASELLHYGINQVFLYDKNKLDRFQIEAYTNVFKSFIQDIKPTALLIGATTVGRQLAPRVAARIKTGLTADCTILDINENTDLVQIRPAFGGNIMAQILTPNHRPQMATVRYKVMNAPERIEMASGEIIKKNISDDLLQTNTEVLDIIKKEPEEFIENAQVLVVAGRGVKKQEDLFILQKLADMLGGQLACTRPLVENGWLDAKCQVGLSGRTVRPKLIITCGVSGAIQFVAGMNHAENIISINIDEKAPIFQVSHTCIVGDINEIIPQIMDKIQKNDKKEV